MSEDTCNQQYLIACSLILWEVKPYNDSKQGLGK